MPEAPDTPAPAAVRASPRERLEDALIDCFSADAGALRRFAGRHYGPRFAAELPGGEASATAVMTTLLDGLTRRGLVDAALFSKLQAYAPAQEGALREVARLWGVFLLPPIGRAPARELPAAGRIPVVQGVFVVAAMVLCLVTKRSDAALGTGWFAWVGVGLVIWLVLLAVPQQRAWLQGWLSAAAAAMRQVTAYALLERARQWLDRVYGTSSLGRRAIRVALIFATLGVAFAVGVVLLSPIQTGIQITRVNMVGIASALLVLIVESVICQLLALAFTQSMLRWIVGRAWHPGGLFGWSLFYLFTTAILATLPALSYFLPPLPMFVDVDELVPSVGPLFEGLNTVQATLLKAHHFRYVLWAIAASTALTACLPSLIVAGVVLAAASARVGAGALYRATGVVLENLAGLPQDLLQLAYAVVTVVGAFLTFWWLA